MMALNSQDSESDRRKPERGKRTVYLLIPSPVLERCVEKTWHHALSLKNLHRKDLSSISANDTSSTS